ncbi:HeH/LEM domain-containing protein [Avibacterium sp. 20-15]|uniref:HeH/LEM domain-containing protein n=1 Tax=unclassified Avibacterium TaxID=2685287 RepID=UPI002025C8D4|nr:MULTISPECIES: HeH/LEM domain-containing protein [unclassified Avibacterium]MCW9731915.1 HeH/LEM domain-containing protein [Avibacterium sp. 20-15]URL04104.1 HeH/LEM domain-containing protein [Avibacterium sp. 20-132]
MGLAAFNAMRRKRALQQQKTASTSETEKDSSIQKEANATEDFSKLKVEELKAKLAELGVQFNSGAKKEELLALLQQATTPLSE